MSKKSSNDATAYKQSEVDEIFSLVKTDKGIIICVGNNKISIKTFKTFKQADEYISKRPYEILINVSVLFSKLAKQDEKDKQNSAKSATNTQSN